MPAQVNMPNTLSLVTSTFNSASFIGACLETAITYIEDRIQPGLEQSASAQVSSESVLTLLKDAQQVDMALCHGINMGFRRYAAAAKPIPDASQFAAAYQNYTLSKVGRTQEDFLQENKAAADDAAMVMQQRSTSQEHRASSSSGPGPSSYQHQRFAPYRSHSPQFRQQGGGGGGGAPPASTAVVAAAVTAGVAATSAGATAPRRKTGCHVRAVALTEH
ncbi:hypothetical protein PLESTF_001899100 [Pleodorina starrii]|nr:hypothetical protein PLESTM_002077000 [Pleodorina starrii]GLC77211.1 hypothetical protein PLESTF_001899100 [Pleodorina starrii]